MSYVPYASVAGSLMYAMVWTKLDLAQAVNVVSRYMGNPGKEHWQVLKHILEYLKGTTNIGLVYHGDTSCALPNYSNSDYATDWDARRSGTGYTFTIGNCLVNQKATLLPIVPLSTTKAEYMALAEATKEGIWFKGLISNLGFPQEKAIILCDGLNAICLAKDQVHHERTNHMDIKYNFICVEKRVEVHKVDTRDNPTDMFTKAISRRKIMHCLDLLNVDCWK